MLLTAIIIDDEIHSVERLSLLLEAHCPEVYLKNAFAQPTEGLHAIHTLKPDLVFLDVQMPDMSGFELLSKVKNFDFHLIFITGYDQYAIQAIRVGALDYLTKPIDAEELKNAVQKALKRTQEIMTKQQVELVLQRLNSYKVEFAKVALPTKEGFEMIDSRNIIYCEGEGAYSWVYFKDRDRKLVSQNLTYMENLLGEFNFIRVHKSYLVNMSEVLSYTKGDGGILEVRSVPFAIPVSRQNKEALLEFLRPKL
jgi:two-component system, LytTR family, response regulator